MKKILRASFLVFILALAAYYFSKSGPELKRALDLTFYQFLIAAFFIAFTELINAIRLKQLFRPFDVGLSFKEWWGISQAMRLGNLLFFKSGTITIGYYLKSQFGLPYSKYIIALTAEKLISAYSSAMIGLVFSFGLYLYYGLPPIIVVLFLAILLAAIFFMSAPISWIPKSKDRISHLILKTIDIWHEFQTHRAVVMNVLLLTMLHFLSVGTRFYIIFKLLNFPISFMDCIVMSASTRMVGLFGLAPGNLGVREFTMALTSLYLGNNFDQGILVASVDRIIETICIFAVGLFYINYRHLKMRKEELETVPDPR